MRTRLSGGVGGEARGEPALPYPDWTRGMGTDSEARVFRELSHGNPRELLPTESAAVELVSHVLSARILAARSGYPTAPSRA